MEILETICNQHPTQILETKKIRTSLAILEAYNNHHTLGIKHQDVWNQTKDKRETTSPESAENSALCSSSYKSSSRPLETNSTVQNVGPDAAKLLSKNGDDPTVQSLGIDRFLGYYSEKRELMKNSLLLLSLFYYCVLKVLMAAQNMYQLIP